MRTLHPAQAKVGGGKVEPGSVEMRALKAFIEGPGNALLQRGQVRNLTPHARNLI